MQGKEGTTKSKGRRGCNYSDNKEVAAGKKGEEGRWQRQMGSTGGSRNDSFGSAGRVSKANGVIKVATGRGGRKRAAVVTGVAAGERQEEVEDGTLLQRRAWLRQRRLRRREEEAEETVARVWRPLAVHCQGLVDGSGREAREEGSTVGSAGSDGQLGNSRARRREKGWKDAAAAMVEREMVAGG
ncbi:hypothetical protein B296_00037870 [Ensete ventricosum]|uniref:Uncharacterized protein n=1 Tax=Ensete ventricosum TaxID=4639 RepID=A0A426X0Q2_ENSVE|nr:hypothetical protein B296_00037870 [Ensete ventricosum]